MNKTRKKSKAYAFTAAVAVLLAACIFGSCKNASGGNAGHSVGGTEDTNEPFARDVAVLTLSPGHLSIAVMAKTADNSDVTVEGCNRAKLSNGTFTGLTAKGTTVTLKGKIIELTCANEQLTAIEVRGLTDLQRLDCSGNRLTALNIQGLNALKGLSCYKNRLTSLDVHSLTALKILQCNDNQLTALNVQGATALNTLNCYNNRLTSLDVHGLTALQYLSCNNNELAAINIRGATALKALVCYHNKLGQDAFISLLTDLPKTYGDLGLYTDLDGEGNCKDFSAPPQLAEAFMKAKFEKNWVLYKQNKNKNYTDL